jgi:hypothetical protein
LLEFLRFTCFEISLKYHLFWKEIFMNLIHMLPFLVLNDRKVEAALSFPFRLPHWMQAKASGSMLLLFYCMKAVLSISYYNFLRCNASFQRQYGTIYWNSLYCLKKPLNVGNGSFYWSVNWFDIKTLNNIICNTFWSSSAWTTVICYHAVFQIQVRNTFWSR